MTTVDPVRSAIAGVLQAARTDAALRTALEQDPMGVLAAAGVSPEAVDAARGFLPGEDVAGYKPKDDCWGNVTCFLLSTCVAWTI
ncbi:MAG: hypothetical protein R3F59_12865 [Myxococcota bacterium]